MVMVPEDCVGEAGSAPVAETLSRVMVKDVDDPIEEVRAKYAQLSVRCPRK